MPVRDKQETLFDALTGKQREVLELLVDNRTTKEIAGIFDVSESAINQRIDTLRQRLGGITRGELARRYRAFQDGTAGEAICENFTGENLHLVQREVPPVPEPRHDPPGRFRFADAQILDRGLWSEPYRGVGPRWLDGDNASWFRVLAMLGILVLIIAALVLVLTAAQVLTDTLGAR